MLKRLITAGVLLASVTAVMQSAAQTKKRTPVPAVVTTARYVAIVPLNANSQPDWFNDSSVSTDDRAIADAVLNALHSWGKYKYTIDPRNADLIIAVRAGRAASVGVGPTIHSGGIQIGRSRPPEGNLVQPRLSLNTSVNAGPSDDTLAIFVGNNGGSLDSPALWMKRKSQGLRGSLPLFSQFRHDVEKSEQILTDKKP